ncbi:MAG: hypothetical protein K6G87_00830 [Butyrivibrio sp.]|uniref:hypothetical protein n=1 Tax=Butyrivibrio sp. TaxID=28121 RepID=UPI0025F04116|nr:hypothetical protein [Butyrivibrio sp.]MCR5769756.1 hypothetical protein [Butyrivibrio sp.]
MNNDQRLKLIEKNLKEVEEITNDIKYLAMGDEALNEIAGILDKNTAVIRDFVTNPSHDKIPNIKKNIDEIEEMARCVDVNASNDHNLINLSNTLGLDALALMDYAENYEKQNT